MTFWLESGNLRNCEKLSEERWPQAAAKGAEGMNFNLYATENHWKIMNRNAMKATF